VFVKVCGLATRGDVAACVGAGADAVGFVLTASPRQVDARTLRRLVAEVPPGTLTVAVFAGAPLESVARVALASGVGAVQLHGSYGAADYRRLSRLPVQLIRAVAAGGAARRAVHGEDMLVVDSPAPGSGVAWDWSAVGQRPAGRWLLAGGLRPHNVAAAIRCLSPWGVDVSSGVERSRGVKDPGLIAEFVAAAKHATEVRLVC
jgi:phosphoribosylanthranilate isomerase